MTWNRLLLASSVLIAGLVAAWPFRHPRPSLAEHVAVVTAPAELPVRRHEVRLDVSPLAESSPAVGLEQLSLKLRRSKSLVAEETKPVAAALESLGSPPPLGQMYESLMRPNDNSAPRPVRSPYTAATSTSGDASSLQALRVSASNSATAISDEADFRPTLQEHRIVDGDTLERLAQRYLGDALRAEEIFELNRDRLRDPNVLPVGRRLRIPQRREAVLTPVARVP